MILPDQPMRTRRLCRDRAGARAARDPRPADIGRLTDSFHLNLTAFGLLSFAVGLFIVHGAIGLAFEQRRPVFRTLRALGVPRAIAAGAAGGRAAGAGRLSRAASASRLATLIAAALLPDVAATLRGLYGAPVAGHADAAPAWWLAGLAMALAGHGAGRRRSALASWRGCRCWPRRSRGPGRGRRPDAALAGWRGAVLLAVALGARRSSAAGWSPGSPCSARCCWARRWRCRCCSRSALLASAARLARGPLARMVLGRHAPAAAGPVAWR